MWCWFHLIAGCIRLDSDIFFIRICWRRHQLDSCNALKTSMPDDMDNHPMRSIRSQWKILHAGCGNSAFTSETLGTEIYYGLGWTVNPKLLWLSPEAFNLWTQDVPSWIRANHQWLDHCDISKQTFLFPGKKGDGFPAYIYIYILVFIGLPTVVVGSLFFFLLPITEASTILQLWLRKCKQSVQPWSGAAWIVVTPGLFFLRHGGLW